MLHHRTYLPPGSDTSVEPAWTGPSDRPRRTVHRERAHAIEVAGKQAPQIPGSSRQAERRVARSRDTRSGLTSLAGLSAWGLDW